MKKIFYFLLLFTFGLSSCEKDDICDANTPTTPRLVISFFDAANPTKTKLVTNLKVKGEDQPEGIIFNESATGDAKYLTSANTISIPLKTNAVSTTYSFILNYGNTNTAVVNTDVLKFNYTTQNVYVSRACGFKTIFTLDSQKPFEQTNPDSDGLWMQVISPIKYNIELENETHIKVFF